MTEKRKIIDLTLIKEGMETKLKIKAVPEIEDFFKRAAQMAAGRNGNCTETSKKWFDENGRGLNFYIKNEKLSEKVDSYPNVMDNFGNGLIDEDRINLALLRIVGISEGEGVTVSTEDLLGREEANEFVQKLADWTVLFYQSYLRDHSLVGSITLELN